MLGRSFLAFFTVWIQAILMAFCDKDKLVATARLQSHNIFLQKDITKDKDKGVPCGFGTVGNGICEDGNCCSPYGWCGVTPAHCAGSSGGTCGGGNVGNGICADSSLCCSPYGWCGSSEAHCAGTVPAPVAAPTPAPVAPTPDNNINDPPKALTIKDLQAALDAYNSFWGESIQANQDLLDLIHKVVYENLRVFSTCDMPNLANACRNCLATYIEAHKLMFLLQ